MMTPVSQEMWPPVNPVRFSFVLGPMLEENLRRAMLLSRGSPTVFVTHPLSLGLLAVSLALLIVVIMPGI